MVLVYDAARYIHHLDWAFLVSQARLDVSDLNFLRILSVLATESPPTLGWGLRPAKVPQPVVDLIDMAAPAG